MNSIKWTAVIASKQSVTLDEVSKAIVRAGAGFK
jgi:hypothetical protein